MSFHSPKASINQMPSSETLFAASMPAEERSLTLRGKLILELPREDGPPVYVELLLRPTSSSSITRKLKERICRTLSGKNSKHGKLPLSTCDHPPQSNTQGSFPRHGYGENSSPTPSELPSESERPELPTPHPWVTEMRSSSDDDLINYEPFISGSGKTPDQYAGLPAGCEFVELDGYNTVTDQGPHIPAELAGSSFLASLSLETENPFPDCSTGLSSSMSSSGEPSVNSTVTGTSTDTSVTSYSLHVESPIFNANPCADSQMAVECFASRDDSDSYQPVSDVAALTQSPGLLAQEDNASSSPDEYLPDFKLYEQAPSVENSPDILAFSAESPLRRHYDAGNDSIDVGPSYGMNASFLPLVNHVSDVTVSDVGQDVDNNPIYLLYDQVSNVENAAEATASSPVIVHNPAIDLTTGHYFSGAGTAGHSQRNKGRRKMSAAADTLQSKTHCEDCGTAFTGKPADQKTNLRRHRRCIHEKPQRYKCLDSNCTTTFSRYDNIRSHVKKLHPEIGNPQKGL